MTPAPEEPRVPYPVPEPYRRRLIQAGKQRDRVAIWRVLRELRQALIKGALA